MREQPWSEEDDLAGDFARAAGDGAGDGEVRGGMRTASGCVYIASGKAE